MDPDFRGITQRGVLKCGDVKENIWSLKPAGTQTDRQADRHIYTHRYTEPDFVGITRIRVW